MSKKPAKTSAKSSSSRAGIAAKRSSVKSRQAAKRSHCTKVARPSQIKVYKTARQEYSEQVARTHQSPRKKPGQAKIIKVHSKEFAKLQQHWYDKLRQDTEHPDGAFADIEWAVNPDSPHIKKPATRARKLIPGKALYYALARNFATHGSFKSPKAQKAWELHSEGLSYRKILKVLKKRPYVLRKSLYWLFYFVDDIRKECMLFNSTNPEGLLYGQDSFADDTLISDFTLETAVDADTQGYELPQDAGYWKPSRRD